MKSMIRLILALAVAFGWAASSASAQGNKPENRHRERPRPANSQPRASRPQPVRQALQQARDERRNENKPESRPADQRFLEHRDRRLERSGAAEMREGAQMTAIGSARVKEGEAIGGARGEAMIRRGDILELDGGDLEHIGAVKMEAGISNQEVLRRENQTSSSDPGPVTRKSEFVFDRRTAMTPQVDDRGVPLDQQRVSGLPDAKPFLHDADFVHRLDDLRRTELDRNQLHWHYDDKARYAHYQDNWGDHWYGFYGDSKYFWLRRHMGRWWFRDEHRDRWYYWRDGKWNYQDPKNPQEAYAYNPGRNPSSGSNGTASGNGSGETNSNASSTNSPSSNPTQPTSSGNGSGGTGGNGNSANSAANPTQLTSSGSGSGGPDSYGSPANSASTSSPVSEPSSSNGPLDTDASTDIQSLTSVKTSTGSFTQ